MGRAVSVDELGSRGYAKSVAIGSCPDSGRRERGRLMSDPLYLAAVAGLFGAAGELGEVPVEGLGAQTKTFAHGGVDVQGVG